MFFLSDDISDIENNDQSDCEEELSFKTSNHAKSVKTKQSQNTIKHKLRKKKAPKRKEVSEETKEKLVQNVQTFLEHTKEERSK